MVKVGLLLVALVVLVLLVAPVLMVATLVTHPLLVWSGSSVSYRAQLPSVPLSGVPSVQMRLIEAAAASSSCGVTASDLAAMAKVESNFGQDLLNPRSGAFGYGQFDRATWAAYGQGDPNNPADALPSMARVLCARGYATDRTKALNSYGGCVTPRCLGETDYATKVDRTVAELGAAPRAVPAIADASASEWAVQLLDLARGWLGVPYLFAGTTRQGIDCSAFTQTIYRQMGVNLPRTAAAQYDATRRVPDSQLVPGDLVFFANTYMPGISHVGIYAGNGQMVQAGGTHVQVSNVFTGYWGDHYAGAGRVA